MKTPECVEILDLLGLCISKGLNDSNPPMNIEFPPTQPTNPNYEIGSFKLINNDGKQFVCAITVREIE